MRAGLVTAPGRFELVEVPEPEARPGTAVVAVERCGICGTDVHGYLGPEPYAPAICGHEWVGRVLAVGEGVTSVVEGERVVGGIAPPCGTCAACRVGQHEWCKAAFLGIVGLGPLAPPHGGFAPRLALDAGRLHPVPDALSTDEAALVEPLTICLHAVNRTPPAPGASVVVVGCGPIGLLTLQCARAAGAGRVTVVEPLPSRRALALALGADAALPPEEARAAGRADVVYECAGVPATLQASVDLVRRGGTVGLVGLASGSAEVHPASWLAKEVTVVASLGYVHHEFAEAMDLVESGTVNLTPLVDETVSLDDLPATIERLATDPASAVKVLVDPTAG
jgi:(R,R)-butanediol dehydrogenase / meso-butanediol dehydrogenase / diacetyl reductase